jgi:hypothetical protein
VPDGEQAPAFWRAQGEAPEPSGRTPEDAPPLAYQDAQGGAPTEEPAPGGNGSPGGNGADPLLDDDVVVLARQTAADEPVSAGEPAPAGEPAHAEEPALAGEPAATGALRDPELAGDPEQAAPPAEPVVTQPPVAAAAPPVAAPTAAASPGGISAQRWSEILTSFVDDPRGSVTMAADVVDSAIEELVNSVRARQRALASSWQGGESDTEQLRTALRDYRTFWTQVQQMSPAGNGRA